jgi:predicted nucleotidyltransferase
MDKEQTLIFVQKYVDAVKDKLDPEQIVLYGSHANNTADEESDIDLAVIYDGFDGDFLSTSSILWQLTREVSLRIEPILLDRSCDPSGFVSEIIKTGEAVYHR